jgi:hypothetical protein
MFYCLLSFVYDGGKMGCSALSAQRRRRPPLTLESGVYYFFLLIFEGRRISAAPATTNLRKMGGDD